MMLPMPGFFLIVCFLFPGFLLAQEENVSARGGFLSDSIKIGEETAFYLAARYPSDRTVLFPDSTHACIFLETSASFSW